MPNQGIIRRFHETMNKKLINAEAKTVAGPEKHWMADRNAFAQIFRETVLKEILHGLPFPPSIIEGLMKGALQESVSVEMRNAVLDDFARIVAKKSETHAQEKLMTLANSELTNTRGAIKELEKRYNEVGAEMRNFDKIRGNIKAGKPMTDKMPAEYEEIFANEESSKTAHITRDCLGHVGPEILMSAMTLQELMNKVTPQEIARRALQLDK